MIPSKRKFFELINLHNTITLQNGLSYYVDNYENIKIIRERSETFSIIARSQTNSMKYYNVIINIYDFRRMGECNCSDKETYKTCKHVLGALVHILVSNYATTLDEIENYIDKEIDFDFKDAVAKIIEDKKNKEAQFVSKKQVVEALQKTSTTIDKNIVPTVAYVEEWNKIDASYNLVFYLVRNAAKMNITRQMYNSISFSETDEENAQFFFNYKIQKVQYQPVIKYDRQSTFYYKCNCNATHSMCEHVIVSFNYLEMHYGRAFFSKYKNWDKEKNELLKPYGLTIADPEAADCKFNVDEWSGRVSMSPPGWLWKFDSDDVLKKAKNILAPQSAKQSGVMLKGNALIDFEPGFLFNFTSSRYKLDFDVEVIKVYEKKGKSQFKKLNIHQSDNLPLLQGLPTPLYDFVTTITEQAIDKHLRALGQGQTFYSSVIPHLDAKGYEELCRYLYNKLKDIWQDLSEFEHTYMLNEGSFSIANIQPVKLSTHLLSFSFDVIEENKFITIRLNHHTNGNLLNANNISSHASIVFEEDNVLYLPAFVEDLGMLQMFRYGFIKLQATAREHLVKTVIPLLENRYKVSLPPSFNVEQVRIDPVNQILLSEMEDKFLLFQPQFVYDGVVVDYEKNPDNIFQSLHNGSYRVTVRNTALEEDFFESVRSLHPKFHKNTGNNFHFLPFEDTMKQNWFVETVAILMQNNITVLGMDTLKQHRYNTNKPKWEMKTGSGIDWFDMQIEVTFGEQVVPLRDIRKALLSKQSVVLLGDGTLGLLPEEWLKQFGMLLKMGEQQKDGTLRLSKLHYTIIDELHNEINDDAILKEINEKKQKLLNIGNIKSVKPDKQVQASLRPYQLSGFQWFHTLDEMGWGGCLADDMGLGKTLQAITFLRYLKSKYKGSTHLVVCPTSLIYNWESELTKFCPSLTYHIYYGFDREFSDTHFKDYDVVITSYGIMRNDFEELRKFEWHYIFLDESQAIKNPDAQTNKALQLYKCKNRMILSGTPVQNNTYDLYAQFNFINPGLLGNREFFRTEFANPIDKNNDTEKSAQLRRLIYPFMLRRTKEQVATDLPDKTETILWCHMGNEQQAVYNDYKNYYRTALMKKIEEVGMSKAGIYVLEGLLRLRQICDSPQMVKDAEVTTTQSVKIDELLREITENTGSHKLLVFSQFTEMLHLIKVRLDAAKITYSYLDGSTPASQRQAAVDDFQNKPDIRVFLISLKAGGVGLNLTAADYVYIVDPWWNPAAEQQAIDRTHRIGQTNKIFAYKMICKDTVEEKIVSLQQRKKQLANDLVTEDAGFVKKLTKDDISYLFS